MFSSIEINDSLNFLVKRGHSVGLGRIVAFGTVKAHVLCIEVDGHWKPLDDAVWLASQEGHKLR
jgi:hypothetical protein